MSQECRCATAEEEFSPAQWREIDDIVAKFRQKPGALIPVLEEVQGITGYLPESVQRRVAAGLGIPLSQVYGVVTFYSFFTMQPRGRHQVRVCMGTACHVRGAQRVLDELQERLHLEPGQCSKDRAFSLDVVRCLGCCALAPVMVVDDRIHRQLKVEKLEQILSDYR